VVDCPSPEFISGLFGSARLSDLPNRKRQQLHCVFHMAPTSVLEDPRYVNWMTKLGTDVHVSVRLRSLNVLFNLQQHIVANRSVCPDEISFTATASMQKRLSILDGDLFRVPWSNMEATNYAQSGTE
jgi:ribonuclease Z